MSRVIAGIVGALVAIAAFAVVFIRGMRRKSPVVLNAVRRVSRKMKPLALKSAGTAGSHASVVRHTGRKSGQTYETPVVAAKTADGFVIALPYGSNTDWLKNVMANGRAEILFDGNTYDVADPSVIAVDEAEEDFAAREQRLHRQFNVHEAVRVHEVAVRVGTATTPAA